MIVEAYVERTVTIREKCRFVVDVEIVNADGLIDTLYTEWVEGEPEVIENERVVRTHGDLTIYDIEIREEV